MDTVYIDRIKEGRGFCFYLYTNPEGQGDPIWCILCTDDDHQLAVADRKIRDWAMKNGFNHIGFVGNWRSGRS